MADVLLAGVGPDRRHGVLGTAESGAGVGPRRVPPQAGHEEQARHDEHRPPPSGPARAAIEDGEQRPHAGKALGGLERHAAPYQLAHARRHVGVADGADRSSGHVAGELGEGLALEGALAVQRLVQRDAEAELIRQGGHGPAAVRLGRHIGGRADEHAGLGEGLDVEDGTAAARGRVVVVGRAAVGLVGGAAVLEAGEAEVGDADAAVVADEHVVGLEVAVDEAGLVGCGEARGGAGEDGVDLFEGAGARPHPLAEGGALDELHGDEDPAFEEADVVHRNDVGVGELGHGLGFATESGVAALLIAGETAAQELQRDFSVELRIVSAIDNAHAANTDAFQHLVPANLGTRRKRRDVVLEGGGG